MSDPIPTTPPWLATPTEPTAVPAPAPAPFAAPAAIPAPAAAPPVAAPVPVRGPTPNECRFCGSAPAAQVTFRGHQGLVLVARFLSTRGPFCRDCGIATFRQMTASTLMLGWWGLISLVATPITIAINLIRRPQVTRLAPPRRDPAVLTPLATPMQIGRPVLARPSVLIVLLLFAGVVTYFSVTGTTNRITRDVGGCVSHGAFVPCSRPHDSVVLKVLEHGGSCPSATNGYVIQGTRVYCLGRA